MAASNAGAQSLDAAARSRVLTAIRRVFAWLHHWRRVVTGWEYRAETFLGFLELACARILLRHL